jgi:glycerol-3-phosphate dehydrogenase
MADYDLAIIGGGLNGVSIARDAAGRGLRVILLEQGDLGGGASSASSRLIHGDLAALRSGALFRVRAALDERAIWLRTAPHLVRPMRFVIPLRGDEPSSLLLRMALLAYDRLDASAGLAQSAMLDLTHHPVGNALKRPFRAAFEVSDCVVDDSRLVILHALDAAERGAVIRTGARCARADRTDTWRLVVIDRGDRQIITARALVNATGAWSASVAETVLRQPSPRVRLEMASQIIVRRRLDTDNVYVFQNDKTRLVYARPYERDFTLIGSVDKAFKGDPAVVTVAANEIGALCETASRYFREPIHPADVVATVSGANARRIVAGKAVARGGSTMFDHRRGKAPLLTIFGGDVTGARMRAERAISKLVPFYPMSARWTAERSLPGGDFPWPRFDDQVGEARARWRFLDDNEARRMVGAYGTRIAQVLGEAQTRNDLGPAFGESLSGAEVNYLMSKEWARFPDDILWRRSKLGLTMSALDREALATFMTAA